MMAPGPTNAISLPEWIFNHTVGESCPWKAVPYRVAQPTELPEELHDCVCLLCQTGPEEHIIRAALRSGVMLTKAQLHNLWQVARFQLPGPKCGSGKKGGIVKKDYVLAALRFYFPDEPEDSDDFQFMFDSLMGSVKSPECSEEVLAAVQGLDPVHQEDWQDVKRCALNQLASQTKDAKPRHKKKEHHTAEGPGDADEADGAQSAGSKRSAPTASGPKDATPRKEPRVLAQRKRYTPGELRSLIPGNGTLSGVYLKRIPGNSNGKIYQGFYAAKETGLLVCLLCSPYLQS